ncbi:hypothetical protein ABFS82_11G033700 [Erythranthe guttata]
MGSSNDRRSWSGGNSSPNFNENRVNCYCGKFSKVQYAFTENNAGRRFLGCCNYQVNYCDFFEWVDPPMCDRARSFTSIVNKRMSEVKKKDEELQQRVEHFSRANEELKAKSLQLKLKLKSLNKEFTISKQRMHQ